MADSSDSDELTDKTTVLTGEQSTLQKEIQDAKEQSACFIVVRGGKQGQRIFINHEEMIIGRDPNNEIPFDDHSISRKHAKISKKGSDVLLTDLGSSNGTVINGKKIQKKESVILDKEDMVKLGNTILKFLPAGEYEILLYGNLESAAHSDPLTKIYNKGYLLEALDAEFKRAKAIHSNLTVLFFDLDHFKQINDNFGHDAGDYVLTEMSSIIRSKHIREKDIFARYGGEEFVILLINTSLEAGAQIAESVRSTVETHAFIYEGKRLPVKVSIGVAEFNKSMESSQALLKSADKALYEAKEGGRNQVKLAR